MDEEVVSQTMNIEQKKDENQSAGAYQALLSERNLEDHFDYSLLCCTTEDPGQAQRDAYIRSLFQVQNLIFEAERDTEQLQQYLSECGGLLEKMPAYGMHHPYEEAEHLLIAILLHNQEHIEPLIDYLSEYMEQDTNIRLVIGRGMWELGEKEEAYRHWLEIRKAEPDYYPATYYVAGYLCEQKKYYEACKLLEERIRMDETKLDEVIEVCEQILSEYPDFFPAYMVHQEACFALHKGQEVIDDYYRAVSIFADYYRPYMYAGEVYFYVEQYEAAKEVYDCARENGVEFSPRMMLFEVKTLRKLAENKEDREAAIAVLDALEEKMQDKSENPVEWDIEDDSELICERGILDWDNGDPEAAEKCLRDAINSNKTCQKYYIVLADLLRSQAAVEPKKYALGIEAMKLYMQAEEIHEGEYGADAAYGIGWCCRFFENNYESAAEELKREPALASFVEGDFCEDDGTPSWVFYYEKALSYGNSCVDACEELCSYYMILYRDNFDESYLEKAITCATRQVEAAPCEDYYRSRGQICMDAFRIEEAVSDFEECIKYREDDWSVWNNLGCCYQYLGQLNKGIECLQKAVECLQKNPDIRIHPYRNMAVCYEAQGEYPKAVACYELDLKQMDPGDTDIYEDIGRLYCYMGDFRKAKKAFDSRKDQDTYYRNMADLFLYKGDIRKSVQQYKDAIRQKTRSNDSEGVTKALYELGLLYANELGAYGDAVEYLEQAVEKMTDHLQRYKCCVQLAKTYLMMGNTSGAREAARDACEAFTDSSVCRRKGRNMKERFIEYMKYRPNAPANMGEWGWIALCLGEAEANEARILFEKMEQVPRCKNCRHAECYKNCLFLGEFSLIMGDVQKAEEYYVEALRRNPNLIAAKKKLDQIHGATKGRR